MRWKYFLMPAERPEVKSALELYALARSDALSAQAELSRLKAKGACMVKGRGLGLIFPSEQDALAVDGIGSVRTVNDQTRYVIGLPDKRTRAGKRLAAEIETVEDLREIWTWSLERALGIYGIVSGGYPPQFYYCKAKPLSDGRVIVQTPAEKNRPKGEGYSRNFDDPVIPDWAVEISANEYADLSELPTYTGAQTSPAV